jgi:beta-glucosidase
MDVEHLLTELTLEEKISLLAGRNFWETAPVPRLKIPYARVTDGPNGARGAEFSGGVRAACFPCSTALAATWDTDLVGQVGSALADEARSKGAVCLLGPTICLHRSPLGGRNFESWSEDPFLTGRLASVYVRGLQDKGIAATVKHFAANEQETKRTSIDVRVSEKALRELYLKPFEMVIREAAPWALMTSYNSVNGYHADMNQFLLETVLRQQWKYEGLVMSDWFGCNSGPESLKAGLDLEMPGPAKRRTETVVKRSLEAGEIEMATIDARAASVLKFVQRTGKFENPETSAEQAINNPEHQKLIRQAGAESIVLMKNHDSILPLDVARLKSVAALGLAKECLASGGGSASVHAHYKTTPLDALRSLLGQNFDIRYAQGAHLFRNLPDWEENLFNLEGKPGITLTRFQTPDCSGSPKSTATVSKTAYTPFEERCRSVTLDFIYKSSVTGSHYLSLSSLGPCKVLVNDQVVIEITEDNDDTMGFLFGGVEEVRKQVSFIQGEDYRVRIESMGPKMDSNTEPGVSMLAGFPGFHMGFMHQDRFEEDLLVSAVEAARTADVALVFVGNTQTWETEGKLG